MKSQLTVLNIWWNIPQNVGPNELCIVWGCVCVCLSLTEGLRGREREREKQSQQTKEIAQPRLAIWD
jgi:hypothetical protein